MPSNALKRTAKSLQLWKVCLVLLSFCIFCVALLEAEPNNADLQGMRDYLKKAIALALATSNESRPPSGETSPAASSTSSTTSQPPSPPPDHAHQANIDQHGITGDDDFAALEAAAAAASESEDQAAPRSGHAVFTVGQRIEARYSVDNLWYPAVVDKVTEAGYVVTFDYYNNVEEVAFENARLPSRKHQIEATAATSGESSAGDTASAGTLIGGIKIPKSLIIHPSDTEEQKAAKKRKLHSLKAKARLVEDEAERNSRQQNWLRFQQRLGGRAATGGFKTGQRVRSIFATPEGTDQRVGVCTSARPMQKVCNFTCFGDEP